MSLSMIFPFENAIKDVMEVSATITVVIENIIYTYTIKVKVSIGSEMEKNKK